MYQVEDKNERKRGDRRKKVLGLGWWAMLLYEQKLKLLIGLIIVGSHPNARLNLHSLEIVSYNW
jgi:hypothetical protein